jgi:hypothetical protein
MTPIPVPGHSFQPDVKAVVVSTYHSCSRDPESEFLPEWLFKKISWFLSGKMLFVVLYAGLVLQNSSFIITITTYVVNEASINKPLNTQFSARCEFCNSGFRNFLP